MERYFIITIHLLLFLQAFYLVTLQNVSDSPAHTFDKDWLRQENLFTEEEGENGQEGNVSGMEASNNFSSGALTEENNGDRLEQRENEASDDVDVAIPTEPPTAPNASTVQPEMSDGKTNATNTELNQSNITRTAEFVNSTTPPANIDDDPLVQNSTISPGFVDHSDIGNTTTLAPESRDLNENTTTNKATAAKTTTSGEKAESTNVTDSNNKNVTTTAATKMNTTSATFSSPNTLSPEATSETTVATKTPRGNLADKQASSGSSSDAGLSSESSRNKRNEAWGAVLGTAVVVSIVGLVAYVVLKRRHLKGFSHRKLVEDFPSDPVLRLDNSEPLDLNFGRSGYYNQGLHGDNIQMANIPGRQTK
ncbi:mucin-15 [Hippocampus comes]|nr:PREDICTED: mucin-15 [Hippocampus comes]